MQELEVLWEWRISGRIEEVRRRWLHLTGGSRDPRASIHQQLLRASLLRYDGALEESDELLAIIEREADGATFGPSEFFQLHFQKGLNAFVRARYAEALQLFMAAQGTTISNALFVYAVKCNLLWCLEYLGLPTASLSEEVQRLETGALAEKISGMRDQMQSFELRVQFRERDWKGLLNQNPAELKGQARWTWLWAREILALIGVDERSEDLERARALVLGDLNHEDYQRSFHLQTFLGMPGSQGSSLKGTRLKDLCDRFYLWTWRWLRNPAAISLHELRTLRNEIRDRANQETIGSDDFQQWRNALLWIGLFEGKAWASLQEVIVGRQPFHRRSDPCYEEEFRLLEKLFRARLSRLPSSDAHWQALPAALRRRIQARSRMRFPRGTVLVVDHEIEQIWNLKLKRKTSSQRLIRLVTALHENPRLPRDEAIRMALGIRRIDPIAHGALWNELLSRLRRFLPLALRVYSRGDYLICEGSWRGVVFLGREAKGDTIESQALELGRRKRRLRELETRVIGLFTRRQQLLRSEIETALGISRAATNRLLDRMAREGKILRSGKTKAARYELSPHSSLK